MKNKFIFFILWAFLTVILSTTSDASFISGGGSGSSSSAAATWGTITGTLSNQTDLQTVLNTKGSGTVLGTMGAVDKSLVITNGTGGVTVQGETAFTFDTTQHNMSITNPVNHLNKSRIKWGNASIGSSADSETNTIAIVADTYKVFLVDGSFTWSADNTNMRYRAAANNDHYMGFNVPNSTTQTLQASENMKLNVNVGTSANTVFQATQVGNAAAGLGTLATTAVDGDFYVPASAGTPTGVPTGISGFRAVRVDSTNNKLCFYATTAWTCVP